MSEQAPSNTLLSRCLEVVQERLDDARNTLESYRGYPLRERRYQRHVEDLETLILDINGASGEPPQASNDLLAEAAKFIDGFAASGEAGFARQRKALDWMMRYRSYCMLPTAHEPADAIERLQREHRRAMSALVRHGLGLDEAPAQSAHEPPAVHPPSCYVHQGKPCDCHVGRASQPPAAQPPPAELAAGIEWLKQEICDGEEYLQRYPNSVDELAQQEHRQRLLDAITGSAQPPRARDSDLYEWVSGLVEATTGLPRGAGEGHVDSDYLAELHSRLAQPPSPDERETLMLRSVGAMEIAEGNEGWERVPLDCPMLVAVAQLRRRFDWLAQVLYCDYGDNQQPMQIGWGIRFNLRDGHQFMYGPSIDAAIDSQCSGPTKGEG